MGVVLYKQRGWKYSNSIVLFFDLLFGKVFYNLLTNNLKQNKRTVAVNLLFPRLSLYSNNGKTGCQPLYVERGTIFSLVVHWLPFQARRLFAFLIKSGGWWRVLDRAKRVSWNRQIPL